MEEGKVSIGRDEEGKESMQSKQASQVSRVQTVIQRFSGEHGEHQHHRHASKQPSGNGRDTEVPSTQHDCKGGQEGNRDWQK